MALCPGTVLYFEPLATGRRGPCLQYTLTGPDRSSPRGLSLAGVGIIVCLPFVNVSHHGVLPLSPPPSSPAPLASAPSAPVSAPSAVVAPVLAAPSAAEASLVVRLLLLHDVDDLVWYAQVFDLRGTWPLLASWHTK